MRRQRLVQVRLPDAAKLSRPALTERAEDAQTAARVDGVQRCRSQPVAAQRAAVMATHEENATVHLQPQPGTTEAQAQQRTGASQTADRTWSATTHRPALCQPPPCCAAVPPAARVRASPRRASAQPQ